MMARPGEQGLERMLHLISNRIFWGFSCLLAMVHRNSSAVEI